MRNILLGGIALVIASCGLKKESPLDVVVEEAAMETAGQIEMVEIEAPDKRPVYMATETVLTDLIHTKLEVNFDWENSRMNGVATITAKPHFYTSDSIILDAKGMLINSVEREGKRLTYSYANDVLRINLGGSFTREEKYTIRIDYVARPEERETAGSAAILSDKGLYFINPKGTNKKVMPQIWTQGETESSSVWFPTIDAPNAKTSQEIYITVEDKYKTLSNGALISSTKLPEGKRVDYWKQELPHTPYLFMLGIGEFKIVKDKYIRKDGTTMEVNYYVEPEWEESAVDIFGETPEMIRFFSELLGIEYPWDKYHQIVVRDYVSGAMENTGAVIFGDYVYKNSRELLDANDQSTIAHELFHHWFGDLVTCESWSNLTLNESFANYSQYLWDEHHFGLDEADYQAEQEANGYYQSAQAQGYHNLVWFDYDDKEQMFDGHSYNKGGRILHMLRNHIGDEAFFEGMRIYLENNKFKAAEFHDLRLAFEEVCGQDLNWFFNQWYLGEGHPILSFDYDADTLNNTIKIFIEQKGSSENSPIFRIPIEVSYFDNDGKHVHNVVIDELQEDFTFPLNGSVKGILYDNQYMLLAKVQEKKSTKQYIFQFYNEKRYTSRKNGLMRGSRDRGEAGQKLILDALEDPFWDIRSLAIVKVGGLRAENKTKGIEKLQELVQNDPNSSVRTAALKGLKKYLEDQELVALYKECIMKDSSYSVVSIALKNYGELHPEDAMTLARELSSEPSSKMLSGIAELYAGYGGAGEFDFFVECLAGNILHGFDKLGVLSSFTLYLTHHNPDFSDKALDIYRETSKDGGFYMNMFLPQNISYLLDHYSAQIIELQKQLDVLGEDGSQAISEELRNKIGAYQLLEQKYLNFSEELEKASGH
jgi:aminopeptidase N